MCVRRFIPKGIQGQAYAADGVGDQAAAAGSDRNGEG